MSASLNDCDSHFGRSQTLAAVILGALGMMIVTFIPSLIGGLTDSLGVSAQAAGVAASAALGGAAAGSLLVLLIGHIFPLRRMAAIGILLTGGGSIAGLLTTDIILIATLWAILGIGSGLTLAASIRLAARHPDPSLIYVYITVGQTLPGVLGFFFFPVLLAHAGIMGTLAILGLINLIMLPVAFLVPDEAMGDKANPLSNLTLPIRLMAISLLCHYVASTMLWAYADRIGVAVHASPKTIAMSLSGAMAIGLLGAGAAALWRRYGAPLPGVIVAICPIVVSGVLLLSPDVSPYILGVLLLNFSIFFAVPLYLGYFAESPGGEDAVTLGGLMAWLGLMIGPLFGSMLVDNSGFEHMTLASIVLFIVAIIMAISAGRTSRR